MAVKIKGKVTRLKKQVDKAFNSLIRRSALRERGRSLRRCSPAEAPRI